MQKVLITGSSGFIGSDLLNKLQDCDYDIYCLYNNHKPNFYKNFTYIKLDILDFAKTNDVIYDIKPDIIIHLAWFVEHGKFWDSLNNYTNFSSTINILRSFKESGGSFFFGAGSFMEYLYKSNIGRNNYVFVKRQAQKLIEGFCSFNNLNYAWGRIFSIFGEYEPNNKLLPYIISNLRHKKEILIKNPYNKFDYIYKGDVSDQIINIINNKIHGNIDIGSAIPKTIHDMALIIADILGVDRGLIKIDKNSKQKEICIAKPLLKYNNNYHYDILRKIINNY